MKKLLFVILAVLCLLALAACGTQEGTTAQTPGTTTAGRPEPTTTGKPSHEHVFGDWTVTTAATCTTDGLKERVCACGEKESEVIAATGHGATEVRDAKVATCLVDGYTGDTYCTVCNEKLKSGAAIPSAGHDYQDGVCSACGEKEPIPSTGLEFEPSEDGGSYYVSGIGTCTDTDIVIPTVHDGLPVTGIGDFAFEFCELTSITIPESITDMRFALAGCIGLTRITVAGRNPVYHSDGNCLIETASKTLVAGCNTSVIPMDGSVTSIDAYAFSYCSDLESITLPDAITVIGRATFFKCERLSSIIIPDGVTSIGYEAFNECLGLTRIEIPNSVTVIDAHAFENCENLAAIVIPDGVLTIGHHAFYGTAYYDDVANWTDNVLYVGNHLLCATQDVIGTYTIREGTKCIADQAFYDCDGLTGVVFPESVTSIGAYAFSDCPLSHITIPAGVTNIDACAFSGCPLSHIMIPAGVTNIGEGAFSGGKATVITVADGNVNYHSDGNCLIETASKTLIVGCGTSVIPTDGSVTIIGPAAFSDCIDLITFEIPDGVTAIGDHAFSGCKSLTHIAIPDSVTAIGEDAFASCTGLTSIVIPDGVTSIGGFAFSWCEKLTSVTIGSGVRVIGWFAFYECDNLTSITFQGTMAQWDAIDKEGAWGETTCNFIIHCTDGEFR